MEARAVKSTERYYILRPETVEAYFYLWRLTKDQKYRDWAWDAAQVGDERMVMSNILGYFILPTIDDVDMANWQENDNVVLFLPFDSRSQANAIIERDAGEFPSLFSSFFSLTENGFFCILFWRFVPKDLSPLWQYMYSVLQIFLVRGPFQLQTDLPHPGR